MVGINLDGFSLANRLRFAKFAKLSPRQTFPLYGILRVRKILVGKILANDCQFAKFANIFPPYNCAIRYSIYTIALCMCQPTFQANVLHFCTVV